MLEIKPVLNARAVTEMCRKCGRVYSAAYYIYSAVNRGEELASLLFEMQGDRVEAVLYSTNQPDDHFLLDGVLRAGLNYAGEQNVTTGVLGISFIESARPLLDRLNVPRESAFDIQNFFTKYKNCGGFAPFIARLGAVEEF